MSPETDRIAIPTNGKGPGHAQDPVLDVPEPGPADTSLAFTPTQLAVGFGIIASLALLLARRMRRRGRPGSRGPFGGS